MYFERTEIQNFKGIEKMNLEFSSGVNLLIGNNGVGKTTVLEALALSIQTYFSRMNDIAKKSIKKDDVHFTSNLVGDASQHRVYSNPTVIKSEINLGGLEYSSEISREDETNATRTKYTGKEFAAAGRDLLNSQEAILPVICYFSTSRVVDTQKVSTNAVGKNKLNDRRCGYIECLNATLDRKALTDWTFKMAMAEYKKGAAVAEYEAFKKAVGIFMQKMNDLEEIPLVEYTRDFEDITYAEDGKTMLVNYLSAGYQSLLWMLMEISFRIALLNPELSDYSQAEGIVLIDEIDMHLHPRWQWKILNALHSSFPKVQFIAATHSPIIISSFKDAKLLSIGENGVEELSGAYAYSIDDVVEYKQGSFGIPQELRRLKQEFEDAFCLRDRENSQKAVDKMKELFGTSNTEVKRAEAKMQMRKNGN
ncbi:AAA family ATPase [Faecalibacterium prausnitzii]|uniref:AAA+ ATPase domain-containing protein n=1 Tax=Faecalibacterium prausnitzii TaxID=853 RepID=A0A329TJH7_9FIRM|nr:AAA family ATPase [Faecalibacterium prausnitzii]RAW49562.1 hypothetical protein C4N25_08645 [Faecalibacterium prausnitzii]